MSSLRGLQALQHIAGRGALESLDKFRITLNLFFDSPQSLNRVPVAVHGGVLQASHEVGVYLAFDLLHHGIQIERGGELGEVDHPVDFPVAIVDVNGIFEQNSQFNKTCMISVVRIEIGEVALYLWTQSLSPPIQKICSVMRQDCSHVGTDFLRIGWIAGNTGNITALVFCRLS